MGFRLLELLLFRERASRREVHLIKALVFVQTTLWRYLFGRDAQDLEQSNNVSGSSSLAASKRDFSSWMGGGGGGVLVGGGEGGGGGGGVLEGGGGFGGGGGSALRGAALWGMAADTDSGGAVLGAWGKRVKSCTVQTSSGCLQNFKLSMRFAVAKGAISEDLQAD